MTVEGDDLLPTFRGPRGGSGCENPECNASDRQIRVLSVQELTRTYPQQSTLPYVPYPPQATHICDKCGYVYSGYINDFEFDVSETTLDTRPDVDIEEYDWDPQDAFDGSIRDAAKSLIAGAPEGTTADELREAIERYIPGLGADDADPLLEESDRDVTVHDLADYM